MGRKRSGGKGVAAGSGDDADALHGSGGLHGVAALPDGPRSGSDATGLLVPEPAGNRTPNDALISFLNEQLAHWTEERRSMNPAARYYVDAFRQVRTFVAGE